MLLTPLLLLTLQMHPAYTSVPAVFGLPATLLATMLLMAYAVANVPAVTTFFNVAGGPAVAVIPALFRILKH